MLPIHRAAFLRALAMPRRDPGPAPASPRFRVHDPIRRNHRCQIDGAVRVAVSRAREESAKSSPFSSPARCTLWALATRQVIIGDWPHPPPGSRQSRDLSGSYHRPRWPGLKWQTARRVPSRERLETNSNISVLSRDPGQRTLPAPRKRRTPPAGHPERRHLANGTAAVQKQTAAARRPGATSGP